MLKDLSFIHLLSVGSLFDNFFKFYYKYLIKLTPLLDSKRFLIHSSFLVMYDFWVDLYYISEKGVGVLYLIK